MRFRQSLSRLLLACACGAGVSAQMLGDNLEPPLFGHFTPLFDHVIRAALADADEDETLMSDAEKSLLALAGKSRLTCDAAKRRALEIAPELLSLADWPLDDHEPVECLNKQHGSVAVLYEALKEIVEIATPAPVVTVTATISGEDAPAAKKSSPRAAVVERQQHYPFDQQLVALDMDSLDEIRGGFELQGSGLKFSIGIERAVFINGNLVASTVLVPKDLQQATGGGSVASAQPVGATGALGIIQNGTGNNISTQQISPNLAGTVIQNTLNDQKIQSVTTINASVNSLQTLRTMSVHNTIQTGIIGSLRR